MSESTEFLQKFLESSNCKSVLECMIMSMVRRIMNEVLNVANDNNIAIYSITHNTIHFDFDKFDILKQKYKERYGWELSRHFLIKGAFLTVQ